MGRLHSPADFNADQGACWAEPYLYEAQCDHPGGRWRLPRTPEVEAMARGLMQHLAAAPEPPLLGNLYGVLLVQTTTGDRAVLKGFSGLFAGQFQAVSGWVPPLPLAAQMALVEPQILAQLSQLKHELMALHQLPGRLVYGQVYGQMVERYAIQLQQLAASHRGRKQGRDRSRTHYCNTLQGAALTQALADLNRESQQDGIERRRLKQERDQVLAPLVQAMAQTDQKIKELKQQYTTLAKQWQTQMQLAYAAEQSGDGWRIGDGDWPAGLRRHIKVDLLDRASAKLLHYAVAHRLKPLAMAEFWWGYPQGEYSPGEFYGASPEDCQALMDIVHMSSQPQPTPPPLTLLYQDETLIVVDKPAGLLSVPGRPYHLQDSVLSRLRHQLPGKAFLQVVHRLDQATSGILVLAASSMAHAALGQQFSSHQVRKTYEAILSRPVDRAAGMVELPLWGNPAESPRQSVSATHGKPSVTQFQVLQNGEHPRVQFVPQTGRTHQIRLHAAHSDGLNSPILGDPLYGDQPVQGHLSERLHLHAIALELIHPVTQEPLRFKSNVPF
ncbi:RluA family pseudouridine synthase [Leptothoe sp. PORK10 BA2]|uniref:RluA family pseudouridine synthase n=1 Tax=Leptothoe sp. PORK10 BA2 TaxID=3110254 RepID=UPI002B1F8864|nr:RluA family pseudouridine synthase [Leptothoe sp. PORK10 BA2]MEA5465209.1 RluA family pseudouridine synthase [Leptothoe sp. PORK10 BA2]